MVGENSAGRGSQPRGRPALINQRLVQVGAAVIILLLLGGLAVSLTAAERLPGDRSPEAGFARDMITHHDQAVKMALLIRDRTDDEHMKSMATDMLLTQTNQMGQMAGWLQVWGLPMTGLDPAMTWMGHGGMSMPGLASPAEIAALAALQATEAEILFLQLMIRHHQGALPMAGAIIEQSDNPQTERLATSIVNAQQVEIEMMTEMLAERGAEPLPPA